MNELIIKKEIYKSQNTIIYSGFFGENSLPVVIKVLNRRYPSNEDTAKFEYEYKICKNLSSKGIIKVLDFQKYNESYAIIMEDFKGTAFSSILEKALDIKEFLDYAIKLADILIQIHNESIVHKDINPSNILINLQNKEMKIIDFGISNVLSKENPKIVSPDYIEGTLLYMSPEQTGRTNKNIDYRTDFYSLGITFYLMITNELPFKSSDPLELIHSHIAKLPKSPSQLCEKIPTMISKIILKLLEKNPEDRYQSAFGLMWDLEKCIQLLNSKGVIDDFNLGEKDLPNQFEILQKLYGREDDIKKLLEILDNLDETHSELMFITGYSGIGKSALVNQIHTPILARGGYFISGKFDQLKQNAPYSSLIHAFQELIKQILTENSEKIDNWRKRITNALGSNGQVMVDVIPQLELIIGKQPELMDLDGEKAQNRFNMVFQNFFNSLASNNNPLVIFLDDLQWADFSTIKMLEKIALNDDIRNILVIGSYRENEVTDTHPLFTTINDIKKNGKSISEIRLTPLNLNNVSELISETLRVNQNEIFLLAQLCFKKTQGNPFFLNQFLKSLYQDNLITYDTKLGKWTWKIEDIERKDVTDNVLDLMANKIKTLPQNVQEILKLASCIGNKFDLKTLSIISSKNIMEVSESLWEAIKQELIIPTDNNYKFINEGSNGLDVIYKFLHDKIQQAAYSLIADDLKKNTHHMIGMLMLVKISQNELDEKIFEIVNHLDMGIELISDFNQQNELIKLNLFAAKKAKKSSAYELANNYLEIAISLTNEDFWDKQYDVALDLHLQMAEVSSLILNFDCMEETCKRTLGKCKNVLDMAKVYEIKIMSLISRNKRLEAVNLGVDTIKLLGVNMSKYPNKAHILTGLIKTIFYLFGKTNHSILSLPEMTDPYKLEVVRVIHLIFTSTYIIKPNLYPLLGFKMTELTLKYGKNNHSASGFGIYAIVWFGIKNIKLGLKWMETFEKVYQDINFLEYKPFYIFAGNTCMRHHNTALNEVAQKTREGYLASLETGNYEYASLCLYISLNELYFSGMELSKLDKECIQATKILKKMGQDAPIDLFATILDIIAKLRGENRDVYSEVGLISEEELLKRNNEATVMMNIVFYKNSILSYLFYNYKDAIKYLYDSRKYLPGIIALIGTPIFYFYDSLILMSAIYIQKKKGKILRKAQSNCNIIKKFAKYAPMNHLHKYYLIKAEIEKFKKNDLKAIEYYDKAINLAGENGYSQEQALANELAGIFHLSRKREKIAVLYLKEARYCYKKWGAMAKVNHLNQVYNELFADYSDTDILSLNVNSTTSIGSTTVSTGAFDLASILKASQAISGEIHHNKLVEKLMNIIVESAGAQKVILILEKEKKLFIDSQYDVYMEEVEFFDDLLYNQEDESDILPSQVINYVLRTKETLVISNAATEENFKQNLYISNNKIQSVACIPLIHQGNLKAILYLENNLTKGAFIGNRLKILDMLSSQMVVLIENSQVYAHLEDLVKQRTKALEELATHDTLTNLPNRRLFHEKIEHAITLAKQNETKIAILFIDLDGFKAVNDNWGHEKGDDLLKVIAKRLIGSVRETDTVARLGGDEFTIILENVSGIESAEIIAKRIIDNVKQPIVFANDEKACVTASIGISLYPMHGDHKDILIKKADNSMYIAKNSGKNQFKFSNT